MGAVTVPIRTMDKFKAHMQHHGLPGSVIMSACVEYAARDMGSSFIDNFFRQYRDVAGDPSRTARIKCLLRFQKDFIARDRFPDGRWSVTGVAKRFGVPRRSVYNWIRRGLITGELRLIHNRRAYCLDIPEANIPKLEQLASMKRVKSRPALPDQFPDGRYSVAGVTKRFGVTGDVVYDWIEHAQVRAKRRDFQGHHRVWWVEISETIVPKLKRLARESKLWTRGQAGRWVSPTAIPPAEAEAPPPPSSA
jgi:transposase